MENDISVSEILQTAVRKALYQLEGKGFDKGQIKTLGMSMELNDGRKFNVDAENINNPQITLVYRCY